MTTESELSRVDLARQALIAARGGQKNGTGKKPRRHTTTAVRRSGRGEGAGQHPQDRGPAPRKPPSTIKHTQIPLALTSCPKPRDRTWKPVMV